MALRSGCLALRPGWLALRLAGPQAQPLRNKRGLRNRISTKTSYVICEFFYSNESLTRGQQCFFLHFHFLHFQNIFLQFLHSLYSKDLPMPFPTSSFPHHPHNFSPHLPSLLPLTPPPSHLFRPSFPSPTPKPSTLSPSASFS